MRVVCIIQARLTSTRLPGKVLLPIGTQPALWHTIQRVRAACLPAIVAIPDTPGNDDLRDWLKDRNVDHYRGPEDDVLARYAIGAALTQADAIVRVTADCPFIDPKEIAGLTYRFLRHEAASSFLYLTNTQVRYMPHGCDVEVFSYRTLMDAHALAKEPHQREHVTPYMQYALAPLNPPSPETVDESHHRWVLDTPEDYEWFQRIAALVPCDADADTPRPTREELVAYLTEHPEHGRYESVGC